MCCSCDDVRAAAPRPLVDVGDLQGNGNERTQHHLQSTLHQHDPTDAKSDKGQTLQRLLRFMQSCLPHTSKRAHSRPHPPHLSLSVVSLWVLLETLRIHADGGAHPATAAAQTKHESGCVAEDDPQTLERDGVIISCPGGQFFRFFYDWNVMTVVSLCVLCRI